MTYNAPFFAAHEAYFLTLKEVADENFALQIMSEVMQRSLGRAYDTMGFQKGNPQDFVRVVGNRDRLVGLNVEFPIVEENIIAYRFLTDPFPGLNGHVNPEKLDEIYMRFKIQHLLGEDWDYRTPYHLWRGDGFTEHIIGKK